jgi:hypothetical protein
MRRASPDSCREGSAFSLLATRHSSLATAFHVAEGLPPATAASPKCSKTPSPALNASQEAKQRPKNPPTKNSGSTASRFNGLRACDLPCLAHPSVSIR